MTKPNPDDRSDEKIKDEAEARNRGNADTWQDLSAPMGETTI